MRHACSNGKIAVTARGIGSSCPAGGGVAALGVCGAALAQLTLVAKAPSYQQREASKGKAA